MPPSISFGDGETLAIKLNQNRRITSVDLKQKQVTLKLEGAVGSILQGFLDERDNNILALINGTPIGADLDIFGYPIYEAYLKEVTPSAPIEVAGITIYESIDLVFQSQQYV